MAFLPCKRKKWRKLHCYFAAQKHRNRQLRIILYALLAFECAAVTASHVTWITNDSETVISVENVYPLEQEAEASATRTYGISLDLEKNSLNFYRTDQSKQPLDPSD